MDIRIHIGVHRTASGHLRRVLRQNAALLESEGVVLAKADVTERAFATAIRALREGTGAPAVRETLLDTITDGKTAKRIVMIDPNISGSLLRPMGREYFYPRVGVTIARIVSALGDVPVRIFAGLRNPATYIPSCYGAQQGHSPELSFRDFISETNLPGLRWSDFLHRAQMKKTDLGLTVWRYEDYPRIWRNVAQALTGIANRELLTGSNAPVKQGPSLHGALLLHSYLADKPAPDRATLLRIVAAFARRFPSDGGHLDPLLWPLELTQGMTENYDDDWYYIERMENVQTIQPRVYA